MPDSAAPSASKTIIPNWLARLLALALVCGYVLLIQWAWGWSTILEQWQSWSWLEFVTVLMFMLLTYFIRGIRVWEYFRHQAQVGLMASYKLTLLHNLANNLLPMRSGEASFPLLMKSYFGLSLSRTTGALLWFRLLDMHTILLIGSAFWLASIGTNILTWMAWFVFLLMPFAVLPAKSFISNKILYRLPEKPGALLQKLLQGMPDSRRMLFRSALLTWANWILKLCLFALVVLIFTNLSWLQAMVGAIGGELSSILPIHAPGGIGTYEAGVIAGATLSGADAQQALQGGVNLHILLIIGTLVGGLVSLALPSHKYQGNS